jgi:paraquat-inducible protein A
MNISPLTDHESWRLLACHECDFLYRLPAIAHGTQARCSRCGTLLTRGVKNSLDKTLAFSVAALILFTIANLFPILALKVAGQEEHYTLFSGAMVMVKFDLELVGVTVFLTTILFPLLHILGLLYILIPLKFQHRPPFFSPLLKLTLALMPWGMVGVYLLGVFVAIVKLADLARVEPGLGLYGLVGLLLTSVASATTLTPSALWLKGERLRP